MHPNNIHNNPYDFKALIGSHAILAEYVFENDYGSETIDFGDNDAVLHLNKALLKHHYGLTDWNIPEHYLCPPIPGRADYIHYIADMLKEYGISKDVKGLDIGMGANCIYSILGSQIYHWKMVGADIDKNAVSSAIANVKANKSLHGNVDIRYQENNANIFQGIIKEGEYFHFTMCNPPFHASEEEATKVALKKQRNLQKDDGVYRTKKSISLNFGGQANELWCNGGEALFIKRMIKQSSAYKAQVGWFTSLVSKKENLNKFYKQLDKLKASHKTVKMSQGNKVSRFIMWKFD